MFDHILEDYLAHLTATDRSHATQRAVRSDLTQFSTWWEHAHQRPFDLTQVVERDLREIERTRASRRMELHPLPSIVACPRCAVSVPGRWSTRGLLRIRPGI